MPGMEGKDYIRLTVIEECHESHTMQETNTERSEINKNREDTPVQVNVEFLNFCDAILRNDYTTVKTLLEKNIDIDIYVCGEAQHITAPASTVLHLAVKKKETKMLQLLLDSKQGVALINKKDNLAISPLIDSLERGNEEAANLLLDKGADVDVTGPSHLHIAAELGLHTTVRRLVDTHSHLVNRTDEREWTPLMTATHNGHYDCVQTLLAAKVNEKRKYLTREDVNGQTLLHIAAQNGRSDVLRLLLNTLPDVEENTENYRRFLNHVDADGFTPLMIAVKYGHVNCVNEFLTEKVQRDTTDNKKNTIYHIASYMGHDNVLKLLLLRDIDRELITQITNNDIATFLENPSAVDVQSKLELEIWLRNLLLLFGRKEGRRQRDEIMQHSHRSPNMGAWKMTKGILEENNDKRNCIHLAALGGHEQCLEVLFTILEPGDAKKQSILLQQRDIDHFTPLQLAIQSNSVEIIKFLLLSGSSLLEECPKLNVTDIETNGSKQPTPFKKSGRTSLHSILDIPHGHKIIESVLDTSTSKGSDPESNGMCFLFLQQRHTSKHRTKMDVVHELFQSKSKNVKEVLSHPILLTYISEEWKQWKYLFWFRFAVYAVYLAILTLVLLFQNATTLNTTLRYILISTSVIVALFCVPYILPGRISTTVRLKYVFLHILPPFMTSVTMNSETAWITSLFSVAVLLSWLSMLWHCSIIPLLSREAAMFRSVLANLLYYSPVFIVIMLGFAFTFSIFFDGENRFEVFHKMLLFTIVKLLQGDTDVSYIKEISLLDVAEGVPTLLFVVIASIAMLNMLVGLAVRSTEELKIYGDIRLLRNQVLLLVEIDMMMMYPAFRYLLRKFKIHALALHETEEKEVTQDNCSACLEGRR